MRVLLVQECVSSGVGVDSEEGPSLSPPVAPGSRIIVLSGEKGFFKTPTGEWVVFICMGFNPWVFKFPFSFGPQREECSWGFSRDKIKASVQSFCSVVWRHHPVQHQASFICVAHCRLSIHCMWGLQGHLAVAETWALCKEAGTRKPHESWERIPWLRGLCILTFLWSCSGHARFGQWSLFSGMTDRHLP